MVLVALTLPLAARAGFDLGSASNYAVLYEGGGNNTLQITNVTVNFNIGVGGSGKVTDSGPSTVNGSIDFSAACTSDGKGGCTQFSNNNTSNKFTGINYNVSAVTSALNTVNALNTSLGGESGTNVSIGTGNGQTLTINATAGVSDGHGNRVFNVTGFNTTNSDLLTINGDGGDSVVLNFVGLSANFNNQVKLNGISEDHVLYNFVGGTNLTGGPTLQINDNASSSASNVVQGVFLDPNGSISVTNAHIVGRVFGGDSHDMQIVSGDVLDSPTPEPSFLGLLSLGVVGLIGVHLLRNHRASSLKS